MDVKKWFEDGTGMRIRELRYLKTPPLPYNVFVNDMRFRGADFLNNIIEHNITFEHYSNSENSEKEESIDRFLIKEKENGKFDNFIKNKEWLQDENMWVTLFELSTILEKVRKEERNA